MGRFLDRTGHRYGRLLVLKRDRSRGRRTYWWCLCDCGQEASICAESFNGHTSSCGCLRREVCRHRSTVHGATSGGATSAEYRSWASALNRCVNTSGDQFASYGGRGIRMCERWSNDFSAFLKDMGPRPPGTSLDRIDNDGNYEPGNCRWATQREQSQNTRRNRMIETSDGPMVFGEFARRMDVCYESLYKAVVYRGNDAITAAERLHQSGSRFKQ